MDSAWAGTPLEAWAVSAPAFGRLVPINDRLHHGSAGQGAEMGSSPGAWCWRATSTKQAGTGQRVQVGPGRRVVLAFNSAWPTAYAGEAVAARAALILAIRKAIDSGTQGKVTDTRNGSTASEPESFSGATEQRAQRRAIQAQSGSIARAMASICNDERALLGVMSGHDRKTLRLSLIGPIRRSSTLAAKMGMSPLPSTGVAAVGWAWYVAGYAQRTRRPGPRLDRQPPGRRSARKPDSAGKRPAGLRRHGWREPCRPRWPSCVRPQ